MNFVVFLNYASYWHFFKSLPWFLDPHGLWFWIVSHVCCLAFCQHVESIQFHILHFCPIWVLFLILLVSFHFFYSLSMTQSPRETNTHLASQDIPSLLLNLNVYHSVHKVLPMGSLLTRLNLVHVLKTYFLISCHLCLCLPNGLFSLGFTTKNVVLIY